MHEAPSPPALGLIGNTPLVRLTSFDTGVCELFIKLESQNPGGSIKDRMAVSMIEAAEQSGALSRGDTIVEATAGNTGIGLALVAAIKAYRLILVIPDKMSAEKVAHARALGADIRLTRSDVGPATLVTTRTWLRGSPMRRQTAITSTSSPIPPTRWRTKSPPDLKSGTKWIIASTRS